MNKPDFTILADNDPSILNHDVYTGFVHGCEYVWRSHVSPLQAEIQTLKEERDRFAVSFAKFCQVDPRGRTFKDLLEEFNTISKKE